MTFAVLSHLAAATSRAAAHPLPEYRFWCCVGMFCDLSLQNDEDGLLMAADGALSFLEEGDPDELEVQFVRDDSGRVVDIDADSSFPENDLVALSRSVALLPTVDQRTIVIELACLALIQNKNWDARALLHAVAALSHGHQFPEVVKATSSDFWEGVSNPASTKH